MPMTGRERLDAIFHRRPADRLSWTALVDGNTLGIAPEAVRGRWGLDFYQAIGCDVLMLDGWNTPYGFRAPRLDWGPDVTDTWRTEGSRQIRELRSPDGVLTMESEHWHPVKPFVCDLRDLRLYRSFWERARYLPEDDAETVANLDRAVGDAGVLTRFWGPSTIPHLLEYAVGMQNFYYLLADHRAEMEGLIGAIHEKELEAFRILGAGPVETVILCENTSTYYISPDTYRRYNGPHVRDFVEIMHAAGKVAIVHMCGHVRLLLDQFRDIGFDGIHALTPPPTGDCPWEAALDALGDDLVIVSALDPTIFASGPVEQIGPALDRLYTPRLRRSNFAMCVFADGLPVPFERFQAVQRWMEKNGQTS